jgi:hypothetical protein
MSWAVATPAQPPAVVPVPTFVGAILTYPAAFHGRRVLVYGTWRLERDAWWLEADGGERIRALPGDGSVSTSRVSMLAEVLDVGRLPQKDPRLATPSMQSLLLRAHLDRWPRPGELVVLRAIRATVLQPAIRPTLEALVLECDRFAGTTVTVVGQFRGANLFNDLPAAPGRDRYAFVLRSGAAALWVTGLRPRVNNVELNLRTRTDTDRWFAVEGTLKRDRGLVWIEGRRMAAAPVPASALPPAPLRAEDRAPAEVMFSLPVDGETDVPTTTTVRIQFTRPIDTASLDGRIRVTYLGEPTATSPAFVTDYTTADRVVTLRFRLPLARFRTLVVEVAEGVTALDGSPVTPWRLTFSTGNASGR